MIISSPVTWTYSILVGHCILKLVYRSNDNMYPIYTIQFILLTINASNLKHIAAITVSYINSPQSVGCITAIQFAHHGIITIHLMWDLAVYYCDDGSDQCI
eukprot:526789_1